MENMLMSLIWTLNKKIFDYMGKIIEKYLPPIIILLKKPVSGKELGFF